MNIARPPTAVNLTGFRHGDMSRPRGMIPGDRRLPWLLDVRFQQLGRVRGVGGGTAASGLSVAESRTHSVADFVDA